VANTEVERHTGVDVEDVPSAEWGWSHLAHGVAQAGGIFAGVFMLLMLRGNQVGKVEDIWLVGFALVIFFIVGRDWWLRRRGWNR
jgi:hypothetical protein